MCGLPQLTSVTLPVKLTVLVVSNSAETEWCATIGAADTSMPTPRTKAKSFRVIATLLNRCKSLGIIGAGCPSSQEILEEPDGAAGHSDPEPQDQRQNPREAPQERGCVIPPGDPLIEREVKDQGGRQQLHFQPE